MSLVVGRYFKNIGCSLAENVVEVVVVAVVSCDPDILDWCKRRACLYVNEQISEIIVLKWADLKTGTGRKTITSQDLQSSLPVMSRINCRMLHWGCCIGVGSPGGDEKVAPRCIINCCCLRKCEGLAVKWKWNPSNHCYFSEPFAGFLSWPQH